MEFGLWKGGRLKRSRFMLAPAEWRRRALQRRASRQAAERALFRSPPHARAVLEARRRDDDHKERPHVLEPTPEPRAKAPDDALRGLKTPRPGCSPAAKTEAQTGLGPSLWLAEEMGGQVNRVTTLDARTSE
jgi:hypothetical protein